MRPSGIGGMAVIEGVMMRNKDEYAVAVRKPNHEIAVEKYKHKDFSDKVKLFKLPIFRGMLAFIDSMVIGIKVLDYSSSFFEEDQSDNQKNSKDTNPLLMALVVIMSLAISVFLFIVLPVLISNLFVKLIKNTFLLYFLEGMLRLLIFIGYIVIITAMKEMRRVFMYHGAEHKVINCIEDGFEPTVENVRWHSKAHKRCGTNFMILVMLISFILFVIIRAKTIVWRVLSRILLVPVIAGISYEFIRLAGRSENKLVNIISKPGLWLQALTTKEPDDDMIEVAIKSVEAVFDWQAFLAEEKNEKKQNENQEENRAAENHNRDITSDNSKKVYYINRGMNVRSARRKTAADDKMAAWEEYVAEAEKRVVAPRVDNDEEDDEILRALDKYLDFNDDDGAE